jgi:gliding motility-associated-like protein
MKKFLLFLSCLSLLSMLSAQNLDSMLLLYYPFSGNANDASGNNYHGTISGATLTTDRFGNPNSAYYFNGINSFIDMPNVPALKPSFPVTISFWVYIEDINTLNPEFITTDFLLNSYTGVFMNIDPSYKRIQLNIGDGTPGVTSNAQRRTKIGTTSITADTWHHIVGVVRGIVDMDIYINCQNDGGSYIGTGGPLNYSQQPGTIGRNDLVGVNPYHLKGKLDEIKYWNRALTPAEVQMLCGLFANAGPNQTICDGQSVMIGGNPSAQNGAAPYTYAWSPTTGLNNPNISNPVASPTTTTTYTLVITDNLNITSSASATVTVIDCSSQSADLYIPNIFSPNDDGLNEVFYVRGEGITGLELLIYNRWGEKIFESADINHGWDGTYKGKECIPGVYTYMVKIRFSNLQYDVVKSGTITLVR